VVKPGTDGLHAVIQAFGAKIALPDGTLDRQKLRHLVFSLPKEKARLEAILHPLIRIETLAQAQAISGIYLIVVVPLLFETDFRQMVDRILVVDCPTELQIMRLTTRDNESEEAAAKVIATQIDRDYRLARANDVIVNDGSLAQLHQAVDELHLKYLTEAKNKP
jgi:dephospho-CoA kinase